MTMQNVRFRDIRLKYQNDIAGKLMWLKNTVKWQECISLMGLKDYDFIIPNKSHYQQLLDIAGKSYMETNALAEILQIDTSVAIQQLSTKLKFILEHGRGIIAVNSKTKCIAGFISFLDVCDVDDMQTYYEHFQVDGNVKYIAELMTKLHENIDIKSDEYGKLIWGGFTFINRNEQRIGLFAALFVAVYIIVCELQYIGTYGEPTTMRLLNMIKLQNGVVLNSVDWENFVFSDGKKMVDFLNELKSIHGGNQKYINKISKDVAIALVHINYEKVYNRAKHGANAWKIYLDKNVKLFNMMKKQKNKQSKL